MSRRPSSGEDRSAHFDFFAIFQDVIHLGRRKLRVAFRFAQSRFHGTTVFDRGDVLFHHHILGAGQLLDGCAAGAMIGMSMTDQQYLDILELESQFGDAVANQGHGFLKAAVNEDMSGRICDQIGGKVFRPHVIQIAGDFERRKGLVQLGVLAGKADGAKQTAEKDQKAVEHGCELSGKRGGASPHTGEEAD